LKKIRNILTRYLFEGEVLRLMGLTILTKPIGLLTQVLLAGYFGAGIHYDAYILAVFLASFLSQTTSRVFNAVATPLTIQLKSSHDRNMVLSYQNAIYLIYFLPVLVLLSFIGLRADIFVGLIAPHAPPETVAFAIKMARWLVLPGLALLGLEMGKTTLNLNGHFRVPAALPMINSTSMILTILLGHRRLGIWSVPLGFTIAQFTQLCIVWVYALRRGVAAFRRPHLPRSLMARLFSLSWLVFISTTFQIVNLFLDKYFATGLVAGSISSIAYSVTILNFGVQIFSFSLVTVLFTRMSNYLAEERIEECGVYLLQNVHRVARIVVPVALALSLTSHEIVAVLFERGRFGPADTIRTASALSMYLLGLPAMVTNLLVTRVFHSLQKMRDKVWLSLQYLLTNAGGNLLLVHSLKVMGLAISSSFAINLHLGLSIWVLQRYRTGLRPKYFATALLHHYLIAFLSFAIYHTTGLGQLFDHLSATTGKWKILEAGSLRFSSIIVIYLILELLYLKTANRKKRIRAET